MKDLSPWDCAVVNDFAKYLITKAKEFQHPELIQTVQLFINLNRYTYIKDREVEIEDKSTSTIQK